MAVTVRPQISTDPPPIPENGGRRLAWHPDAIADVVFREPAKRELAVAEVDVREFQERVVDELRWLHRVIENLNTELAIERSSERVERAQVEADRITTAASAEAAQIVAAARRRAADMVDAVNTVPVSGPGLPQLDVSDLAGSMQRRIEYVTDLFNQVRSDADVMTRVGDHAHVLLDAINDPPVPATEPEPEPTDVIDAGRGDPRYLEGDPLMEYHTNESDDVVIVTWGASSVPVPSGRTVRVRADQVSDDLRRQLAGEPAPQHPALSVQRRPIGPDDECGRCDRGSAEHGIVAGEVLRVDDIPIGVFFTTLTSSERDEWLEVPTDDFDDGTSSSLEIRDALDEQAAPEHLDD